jgi:LAGLIDADG-like domain
MSNSLAYILGFTLGDGNISKSSNLVRLYNQNLEFVKTVLRQRFMESFGVEPGISFDKSNNSYVLHKTSPEVWRKLYSLGVPAGRKARIIRVPEAIKASERTTKAQFISGVSDAEASSTSFTELDRHPRGYSYFELKMYSPKFVNELATLLVEVSEEFKPRVYHYDYGSILRLNGKEQLGLVSSRLNLMHPRFSPPAR